jgi:hypothetical protein
VHITFDRRKYFLITLTSLTFAQFSLTAQALRKADASVSDGDSAESTKLPSAGSLRGVTVVPGGFSLAAVKVVVQSLGASLEREVVSGPDGAFLMTGLAPGSYRITASKEGFTSAPPTTVEVAADRTVNATLELAQARGSLRVVTLGRGSFTLGEVTLEIRGAEAASSVWRAVSDANGIFKLDDLQPGKYEISASREGFGSASPVVVEIAEHRTTNANVLLADTPPAEGPTAAEAPPDQRQGKLPEKPPQVAPAPPRLPEALEAPTAPAGVDTFTPFAYGDFTWLNGAPRTKEAALDTKFFTPEVRFDSYMYLSFNQPRDHSMGGSTEVFRSGEFQVEQASIGGDFHWQNVRGRILLMNGMFASTTPRNDPSVGNGQWDLRTAYRYVSEAWGGYHFNVNHGLNVDAGIFVSYIGLFSYYNFDNWTYQPSFVSSNTPWFFNGLRIQWFPTNKLKIEPWIINGWQAYARANGHHGFGGQILYRPKEWLSLVFNNYGSGTDTLGVPNRTRYHTDDSIEIRYYNRPENKGISKMAFSLTGDAGCETGGGVTCHGGPGGPKQSFLGWMGYNRIWFHKDLFAITAGYGQMNNPGRYLTLLPPINGADAVSGSPYFTENPGDKAHMWDTVFNVQWMPKQYITWWAEFGYRHSDVPYWSGRGGITPPGGNNGAPAFYACNSGVTSGTANLAAAQVACGGPGTVWFPDLRRGQAAIGAGILVKF